MTDWFLYPSICIIKQKKQQCSGLFNHYVELWDDVSRLGKFNCNLWQHFFYFLLPHAFVFSMVFWSNTPGLFLVLKKPKNSFHLDNSHLRPRLKLIRHAWLGAKKLSNTTQALVFRMQVWRWLLEKIGSLTTVLTLIGNGWPLLCQQRQVRKGKNKVNGQAKE